jgi:hypothetical protein
MTLFTAIALTAMFIQMNMAQAWIVWCWVCYAISVILTGIVNSK